MGNPVVTFLSTRNGYTFEEGVAVFAMYTANRFAVERVRRSRDMRLLQQELKKLAHIPGLKPVQGSAVPTVPESVPTPTENVPIQPENVPKEPESVPKTEEIVPKLPESSQNRESEATDSVTYADLAHYKYTRYDDTPTPETQQLWLRNNDRWHRKIDLFAKMKLLPEGDELAAVRKELVEVSREHRKGWKLINELCEAFHQGKKEEPAEQKFNVSTYRAYICKMLAAEKINDKQFITLQQRVNEMLAAQVAFDEETLEKLRAKGISC